MRRNDLSADHTVSAGPDEPESNATERATHAGASLDPTHSMMLVEWSARYGTNLDLGLFEVGASGAPADISADRRRPWSLLPRVFVRFVNHVFEFMAEYGHTISLGYGESGRLIDLAPEPAAEEPGPAKREKFPISAAFTSPAHPRSASPRKSARLAASIAGFRTRQKRRRDLWRTISFLEALDDVMLRDIGLHYGQIESVMTNRHPHM